MEKKLEEALMNVETSYHDVVEIANDIINPIISSVNDLVNEVSNKVNNLSIDQIRDFILRLQLKAFEIAEIKEKSAMKAELAEAIQKEKYAVEFNAADGTAAAKTNIATVNMSGEVVSEVLYNLVANLLKTKLDQLHRLVSALSSILTSRMQEAKFMQISTTADGSSPYTQQPTRQILNENY